MSKLKDIITESGLEDRVLSDSDLSFIIGGTQAARYGLVNKALKSGDLIRIRRGLYSIAESYRRKKLSTFYLACRICPNSYISLESALSFHGWIPEGVTTVNSILQGRTKQFKTPYGEFIYRQLPTGPYEFFTGVSRVEEIKGEPYFIASPLRALTDYVYIKKMDWGGLDALTDGLRIEPDLLNQLSKKDFAEIIKVYNSKRVINFLTELRRGLNLS